MNSILIFCKTLLKGGAEKQALTLSRLIKNANIKIVLVNWSGDQVDNNNLDFVRNNSITYFGLSGNPVKKLRHFLRIVKDQKTIIILSYLTLPNFISGITKLFNREVLTIGGIRTEKLPLYKFLFEKMVHNYLNDATVFNNYSAKTKFQRRGFNEKKIHVIHNAINVSPLSKSNRHNDAVTIISVSRFVRSKDFLTALTSVRNLKAKNPEKKFKYNIVGYGPMESEIRKLVIDLKLENEVNLVINPLNVPEILVNSDIYLSTSLFEGLSNSIMEAMLAGLPVVATDVGDNEYLVKDAYNGYIVPCMDTDLIVEKLGYLANFEEVREDFGHKSHLIIEKEFSEEKLFENYINLFTELLSSKGSTGKTSFKN